MQVQTRLGQGRLSLEQIKERWDSAKLFKGEDFDSKCDERSPKRSDLLL